jgi:hypothetical protein
MRAPSRAPQFLGPDATIARYADQTGRSVDVPPFYLAFAQYRLAVIWKASIAAMSREIPQKVLQRSGRLSGCTAPRSSTDWHGGCASGWKSRHPGQRLTGQTLKRADRSGFSAGTSGMRRDQNSSTRAHTCPKRPLWNLRPSVWIRPCLRWTEGRQGRSLVRGDQTDGASCHRGEDGFATSAGRLRERRRRALASVHQSGPECRGSSLPSHGM